MILAIDPGTHCGWAVRHERCDPVPRRFNSGVWDISRLRLDGAGMRFVRLRNRLDELYKMNIKTGFVVFEDVRGHKGTYAAQVYGGIMAVVLTFAEDHSIDYGGVNVWDLKRFATGTTKANKDVMLAAAQERWPTVQTHDEADARWLAEYAAKHFRG